MPRSSSVCGGAGAKRGTVDGRAGANEAIFVRSVSARVNFNHPATRFGRPVRQYCLARLSLLLVSVVLAWCAPVAHAAEPSAGDLYKDARKAEKKKDFTRAYLLYSEASAKDPSYKDAWVRA